MADQADIKTVRATIVSIGSTEQVTPKYSKFSFEYTVAGNDTEVFDGESPAWHKGKIEAGKVYELTLKANPNPSGGYYTPSIEKVTPINDAIPQKPPSTPKPPVPVSTQDKPSGRRPDLNGRWREYSSHARTAQMQATERVGHKVKLLLSDRLVTEDDKPISKIKESTLATWYIDEYDSYWTEIEQREPIDSFGNLKDEL